LAVEPALAGAEMPALTPLPLAASPELPEVPMLSDLAPELADDWALAD